MDPPCVLVVDDSPTIRKLVEITLRRQGFQVVFAENGITTLAALTRHRPDLIILDIMLPAINGYQICQVIKRHPQCRGIPLEIGRGEGAQHVELRVSFRLSEPDKFAYCLVLARDLEENVPKLLIAFGRLV